jgi:hypothetical protein
MWRARVLAAAIVASPSHATSLGDGLPDTPHAGAISAMPYSGANGTPETQGPRADVDIGEGRAPEVFVPHPEGGRRIEVDCRPGPLGERGQLSEDFCRVADRQRWLCQEQKSCLLKNMDSCVTETHLVRHMENGSVEPLPWGRRWLPTGLGGVDRLLPRLAYDMKSLD